MKNTTKNSTSPQSKDSGIKAGRTLHAPEVISAHPAKAAMANRKTDGNRFEAATEWSRAFHQVEADEQLAMLGDRDGALWAGRQATKAELRRLAQAWHTQYDWYFGAGSSAYSDAERFFFMVHPEFDGDRSAASEFWGIEVTGEREMPETAYVQAFAEGAMGIWDEVKSQISAR